MLSATRRRYSQVFPPVKLEAVSSLSTLRPSCPCLIARLWGAAVRGVGLHRQGYICLSVITNQDDGYMGNYHWQLIPKA